jgi:hypothetical protein
MSHSSNGQAKQRNTARLGGHNTFKQRIVAKMQRWL